MSLKNRWRKLGRIEFRRETRRLSDGTPDGDVLYIRVRGRACVTASMIPRAIDGSGSLELWGNDGLNFRPRGPVHAARQLHAALIRRATAAAA